MRGLLNAVIALAALGVALAPACTPLAATPTPPVVGLSAADYAVYDAIIASNWPRQMLIVMEARTTNRYNDTLSYASSQMPDLQQQTVDSFLAANQSPSTLADRFQIRAPRVLLSQADKDRLFDRDLQASWRRFHAAYPSAQGLLAFSRVSFNADQTQALVYFQNGNGGKDAAGYMVLLAREPGGWVVKKQLMIWIA